MYISVRTYLGPHGGSLQIKEGFYFAVFFHATFSCCKWKFSTKENPTNVINRTLQKGETPRKKCVQNVQIEEVQTHKGKDIQKSTEVPKKVTFKNISPN